MNIGVFSCDPGGHTGMQWGVFVPEHRDVGVQLKNRLLAGSTTITGTPHEQIGAVCSLWASFYGTCVKEALLPPERVWFVMEDYIYTAENTYGGDSASISTALIWGIEGYRMGRRDEWLARPGRKGVKREVHLPPTILQTASQAKAFATPARFRQWDCWEVGFAGKREHEFSAMQHIAYFLKKYDMQHGGH